MIFLIALLLTGRLRDDPVRVEGIHYGGQYVTAASLRAGLEEKCKANPVMIGEIEVQLPTNGKGLITHDIMRRVFADVDANC